MKLTDPNYLRREYGDGGVALRQRIDFYDQFRSQGDSWQAWLVERLLHTKPKSIVDVGCGLGTLWTEAIRSEQLPKAVRVVLVDASSEMVSACGRLFASDARFTTVQSDATTFLREAPSDYDLVFAGHLVYHLRSARDFVRAARRALTASGCLAITSVGDAHLASLTALLARFRAATDLEVPVLAPDRFRTRAALCETLAEDFDEVQCLDYRARLAIDDIEALMQFFRSRGDQSGLADSSTFDRLRAFVEHEEGTCVVSEVHNRLAIGWSR